jgi:DNA-binding transcriptional MerR regulator
VLISELSRASGTPVPTIKYYLREGLLPPGEARSATRASYDDRHVARLRLIRALVDVGGLPLQRVRDVLGGLDQPPAVLHHLLGVAHTALAQPGPGPTSTPAADGPPRPRAADVLAAAGWTGIDPASPTIGVLDRSLAALSAAGLPVDDDVLRGYWEAAGAVAQREVSGIPTDPAAAVEYVVLGTVLYEPLLLALRRLAQEDLSAQRFRAGPDQAGPDQAGPDQAEVNR